MSPKQYKDMIQKLGLSQEGAGLWLGVSERTGQNYAAKGPPAAIETLFRLMIALDLTPDAVDRLIRPKR